MTEENLIRIRGTAKGRLTRLLNSLKNVEFDVDALEVRKSSLSDIEKEWSAVQLKIECLETYSEQEQTRIREEFEKDYFECAVLINKALKQSSLDTRAQSITEASHSQLVNSTSIRKNFLSPKIEIAPFDGSPLEWHSFRDSFTSLVHDDQAIPAVQKFQLLKNLLRGEVSSVIASLNATEENYNVAWDLLKKRCERPRQIIQAHLKLILELPEITHDSPSNLRAVKEGVQTHVNALRALNQPVEQWDAFLVFILVKKLDKNTRRNWERTLENDEMPTFNELLEFLNKQSRGDELDVDKMSLNKTNSNQSFRDNRSRPKTRHQSYVGVHSRSQCCLCKQEHLIYTCQEFLSLTARERAEFARKANLCLNCLRDNHTTPKCFLSGCRKCRRKHNTLLHFADKESRLDGANDAQSELKKEQVASSSIKTSLIAQCNTEVLLGTARVKIIGKNNKGYECRVLLDSGSQTNFITEKLANLLGLEKEIAPGPFSGLGQLETHSKYIVKASIQSRSSQYKSNELTFFALPKITGLLPIIQINKRDIQIPQNVILADPEFHRPQEVHALLGNKLFYRLLNIGQIELCNGEIILQKTRLGWIVTGEARLPETKVRRIPSACHLITSLDKNLNRFWEIEEMPPKVHLSKEESLSEEHFLKNTSRNQEGRYSVRLPFNEKRFRIGETYSIATKRLNALMRKFPKNEALRSGYKEFLKEYENLGHMTNITDTDNPDEGYYLPHHAVIKESSATTKIRVVFDGSAKSSSNISLNDSLLVGPKIQDDLIPIIIRFCLHKYVLKADIEKMFRQVLVHPEDAIYQKIVWREDESSPLQTFRLNTVTYGTACASYLAVRCLKQLAIDEQERFPEAAAILKRDFYMDDLHTGADSIEKAETLKRELINLLRVGGFNLRQWASNDQKIISDLKDSSKSQHLCLEPTQNTKVLGIQWDPSNDSLSYAVRPLEAEERATKRTILSQIAQLFDPLGLLGPVIVLAKLIMQELWKEQLNWDASLPATLHTSWVAFKRQLPLLNKFSVKRRTILDNPVSIQLHGFADASEKAYGACIYLRSTDKNNRHFTRLICAKSRVAPLKTVSLPRLELCAAGLLARLYKSTSEALNMKFQSVKFWSDSTISLHWIKTSPHFLKTFVANRVAEIQSITNSEDWFHVSSSDNPADAISRGQETSIFLNNIMWLKGPTWLEHDEVTWPESKLHAVEIPEKRAKISLLTIQGNFELFERFSSITALNRFIAACLRLIRKKKTGVKKTGGLSAQEIEEAHLRLIKLIQAQAFSKDIKNLKNSKNLDTRSKLLNLNPFLDHNGILRVGGRLKNAEISYAQKHPILLPRSQHVTNLIVRNEHLKNYHAGIQATLNFIRHKYWIIDGKNAVRHIIRRCIRCFKVNPTLPKYIMGNLPANRVKESRPFENSGIDYCGPFYIKEKQYRNRGKVKIYVAVFVCLATKAAHLELVSDMTAEACLAAINRFFDRRGMSRNIYTDNGTNFVGSKNELSAIQEFLSSIEANNKIQHSLANEGVNWHFSPPRSPHFGGLWEASVKLLKHHLHRTVGDCLFTYEQFNTYVIRIEAILNSRPLIPLSSDPNDLQALTPAHFLIGDSLKSIPDYEFQDIPTNRLSLWQHIQKVKQHFWSRWYKEYLNELQTRSKWHHGNTNQIKVGTLITLKEDKIPPMRWKLGRIIEVHPGDDGVIRVATVKTPDGIYKRGVKSLCPLPLQTD